MNDGKISKIPREKIAVSIRKETLRMVDVYAENYWDKNRSAAIDSGMITFITT